MVSEHLASIADFPSPWYHSWLTNRVSFACLMHRTVQSGRKFWHKGACLARACNGARVFRFRSRARSHVPWHVPLITPAPRQIDLVRNLRCNTNARPTLRQFLNLYAYAFVHKYSNASLVFLGYTSFVLHLTCNLSRS